MFLNKARILALLLMVIVAGSVRAEDAKEVVVSSAEELKGIEAKKIIWKKDGAKMVLIPSTAKIVRKSTFDRLGDPIVKVVEVEGSNPVPFYMDATEVTVGQFKKFLKSTDHPFDGELWNEVYKYSPADSHPIIGLTWNDVMAYVKWAGKRLPTEAEWEFAARGGLVDKEFPWGDDESVVREYANSQGTGGEDQWNYTTAPVGSFRPNGYGLYDMAGNVWEWCASWYNRSKYPGEKAVRGGGIHLLPESLHVGCRASGLMSFRSHVTGFRCVLGVLKLDPSAQFEGNYKR